MSPSIPHLYSHNLPETCSYSMEYNSLTVRDNQYFQETVSKIERYKSCTRLTYLVVRKIKFEVSKQYVQKSQHTVTYSAQNVLHLTQLSF